MSKMSVVLGGTLGGNPWSPYASSGGQVTRIDVPRLILGMLNASPAREISHTKRVKAQRSLDFKP